MRDRDARVLHDVYTVRSSRRSVTRPISATIASCKHAFTFSSVSVMKPADRPIYNTRIVSPSTD